MDLRHLKLVAVQVEELLEQYNVSIDHAHALDLVAALPGLRDWKEVVEFPDRVAWAQLNGSSAGRLAFRMEGRFGVRVDWTSLLEILSAPSGLGRMAPEIFPTGAPPGVYVTSSAASIHALLKKFEEASDGSLIYAERAGASWEGCVDLADDSLWVPALQRAPSGTLIVLGPLSLKRRDLADTGRRLRRGCIRALESGHRVAVLLNTPMPKLLHSGVRMAVEMCQAEGEDNLRALKGVVTSSGDIRERDPVISSPEHLHSPEPSVFTHEH